MDSTIAQGPGGKDKVQDEDEIGKSCMFVFPWQFTHCTKDRFTGSDHF